MTNTIGIIACIAIIGIPLLISGIMRHRQQKAMRRDLDDALFRRVEEEWRE